jgi:hypothetical protein
LAAKQHRETIGHICRWEIGGRSFAEIKQPAATYHPGPGERRRDLHLPATHAEPRRMISIDRNARDDAWQTLVAPSQ